MEGNFQGVVYFVTLILALFTAISGIILANNLFKNKLKESFNNTILLVFTLLAFGYSLFALGELSWYLIFDVFKEMPSLSMPDFYWVIGSAFLFIGFTIFSAYMYRQHRDWNKLMILFLFGVVVFGAVYYFVNSLNLFSEGKTAGKIFLGYFYPLVSTLILISSASVYLFLEKINNFRINLLMLFLANIAFLFGDLLYVYYTVKETYGIFGAVSDTLYILAYFICGCSLFSLWIKTK